MIGLCTDSSAQLPLELRSRHVVEVVPATVVIDGDEHLDDAVLVDTFYERIARSTDAVVTTVEPSSGQFAAAYDDLISRGCTEILSLHSAGTVNAARLAAHGSAVPVRVADPGGSGFELSCSVWAAGEAVARGASLDQVMTVAERVVPLTRNLFIVDAHVGVDVVTFGRGDRTLVGHSDTMFDAINLVASTVVASGTRLRVAVGHSDPATAAIAEAVEAAAGEPANVIDVVRYRIGPSAGAQALPGTVACYWFPAD